VLTFVQIESLVTAQRHTSPKF